MGAEDRAVRRILLVVAYDGTAYNGFARQSNPSCVTIEGTIDAALSDLTGEQIRVIGASRTDAGVHALCNYCVFDTASKIPAEKFAAALNVRLPEDIRIRQSRQVEDTFHPRNMSTIKTYEYHIYNARIEDPLRERYCAFTYFRLDTEKMRQAAAYLVGEHDFKSFANVKTTVLTTVREILSIEIEETIIPVPHVMYSVKKHQPGLQDEAREIVIRVSGRGFLYNMVRIIAGTLMDVGRGLRTPEQVKEMLDAKERTLAGPTAPAKGLILTDYLILGPKPVPDNEKKLDTKAQNP
ncbi:MAG: tRNA pseudouridine(38-40) synthase TruA [Lachnospiraceae bacterium]|jgi:tRNA pseudouridine(38-40) synthase